MKHLILTSVTLLLLFLSTAAQAQFNENIRSFGGSYYDRVTKVMHDKDDNLYIMGDIGMPGRIERFGDYKAEEINFGSVKKAIINGFIAKFDKNNQCLWVRESPLSIRSPYSDFTVDDAGFVYVTGNIRYGNYFLEKLDANGNLVWEKTYPTVMMKEKFFTTSITVDAEGNIYMVGSFDGSPIDGISFNVTSGTSYNDYAAKFDSNGKAMWVKSSLGSNIVYTDVLKDSKGNILTVGGFIGTVTIEGNTLQNNTAPDSYGPVYDKLLIKRDPDGNLLWVKSIPVKLNGKPSITLDSDDNIYFVTENFSTILPSVVVDGVTINRTQKQTLIKLNSTGTVEWSVPFSGSTSASPLIYANNSLYLANSATTSYQYGNSIVEDKAEIQSNIGIFNIALNGELISIKVYKGETRTTYHQLSFMPKQKEIVIAGTFINELQNNDKLLISKGEGDIYIGQLTDTLRNPVQLATVSGKIFNDENSNCIVDAGDTGLSDKMLKIEPGSQYVKTDVQGNYSFKVPYGTYTVTPQAYPIVNPKLISVCKVSAPILADSAHQVISNVNFGYNVKDCYQLTVDIAADRRRRCMRSNTTVTYANEGTLDAHNVKIKVLYPKYVVPIRSNLPWTARLDSALIFDIGTLKAGERKSFVISDSTICGIEEIRGLSQCVKAIITPKNSCEQQDPVWSMASVAVMANYINEGKVATFAVTNNGEGDMPDSTSYRMYANYTLLKKGKVKLAKGASAMFEVPANVATYRIEADQVPHHPGESRPAASIQPSTIPTINIQTNTAPIPIDAFYLDDADAEKDIFCQEITDSYDPNDKQVSPRGITSKRYITAEDELEYLIRFQNTGTDVAYNIVVKDTISEHLDIATLQVGSASHPFTYTVSGEGKPVVTFRFKDINLPDHKRNEPGSHGYIKFRIAQRPDNPKGTVIRNTAYNYFDFNSPIATNEVINVIGDTVLAPTVPTLVFDCAEDEPTIAQATSTITLCETNQVTLQANAPVLGLGKWILVSGQATIVNPESPTSEMKGIGYGETVLEWTITLCKKVSRAQVKINRYKLPSAPQITALPVQCEGSQLMPLVATGENIAWYKDAAKQYKLHTRNSFTPVTSVTTTYYATQTVNGCESPVQGVVVTIQPAEVTITANADTLIAPVADSYQWYFNGEQVAEGIGKDLVAKNTGQYYVKTMVNGCVSVSKGLQHTINLPVSVLTLSPNPAGKDLVLEFAANPTGEMRVIVRNQLGQQVLSNTWQKRNTVHEQTINIANLAQGLYFIDVQVGNQIQRSKFVKL